MASRSQSSLDSQHEKTVGSPEPFSAMQYSAGGQIKRVNTGSSDAEKTVVEDPDSPEAIAESFRRLTKRIFALDSQLQVFSDECRQLGRSYDLVKDARTLREGLEQFLRLFYHNAKQLSPRVQKPGRSVHHSTHDIDNESLPSCLETVAAAFEVLRERLHEFREYTDEDVNIKSLMELFVKDLKYRVACLHLYRTELRSTHIRIYVHSFADEIGENLDNIVKAFRFFNKYGMPAIRYEQKRESDSVLQMSTMATFFSAVTATTLQTSLGSQQAGTSLSSIVDTFWFCSLVLSIGAALNSLLRRGTYGTRWRRLPLWVTLWIRGSAPMFLTLSIACFSTGLVLFTYASKQNRYTSILTIACTGVTSFGLVVVSIWIAYQQWIAPFISARVSWSGFSKNNQGQPEAAPIPHPRRSWNDSFSDMSVSNSSILPDMDPTPTTVRAAQSFGSRAILPGIRNVLLSLFSTPDRLMEGQARDLESAIPVQQDIPTSNERPPNPLRMRVGVVAAVQAATTMFWRGTARTAPRMLNLSARAPGQVARTSSTQMSPFRLAFRDQPEHVLKYAYGEVCDLEYSPGGLVLAVTSFDRRMEYSSTVIYYNTGTATTHSYRHRHPQGRVSEQVTWSPSQENMLLVRLDHSIDLFDTKMNLSLIRTINRPRSIKSAAWCTSTYILSAEGCDVFKLSLDGNVIIKHRFDHLFLRDIAVVPNTDLLLIVGRVMHKDMLPENTRAEKQLILYDMNTQKYQSRNPLLDDMRHITIADHISSDRHGLDVLVGHKNMRSPQVWTLIPSRDGFHRLKPASIKFLPFGEFTGPGYFAGDLHQMMSCVDNDGSIHIWDRESAKAIRNIPAKVERGGRRCVAWSAPEVNSVQFATVGVNSKELKFWSATQHDPSLPSPPSHLLPPAAIPYTPPPSGMRLPVGVAHSRGPGAVSSSRMGAIGTNDGPLLPSPPSHLPPETAVPHNPTQIIHGRDLNLRESAAKLNNSSSPPPLRLPPPIAIPPHLPPGNMHPSTEAVYGWDLSAGEMIPSPRSAISMNFPDIPPQMYPGIHPDLHTEEDVSIHVETPV